MVDVGLRRYRGATILTLTLPEGGEVLLEGRLVLKNTRKLTFKVYLEAESAVRVKLGNKAFTGTELVIRPSNTTAVNYPDKMVYQSYGGVLIIRNSGKQLFAINRVPVFDYLESVIADEMGSDAPLEALKAQAVASRTFLLKNFHKHQKQGYNVCDSLLPAASSILEWSQRRL